MSCMCVKLIPVATVYGFHSFEASSAAVVVVGTAVSCWVESAVAGGGGVATLENLSASSSSFVIRRVSSASGERDLAQGKCSEVT